MGEGLRCPHRIARTEACDDGRDSRYARRAREERSCVNAVSRSVADQVHAQQSRWSAAASAAKRRIVFWRAVILILGVAGAVLATLGTQLGGTIGPWLALAGGVAIGEVVGRGDRRRVRVGRKSLAIRAVTDA